MNLHTLSATTNMQMSVLFHKLQELGVEVFVPVNSTRKVRTFQVTENEDGTKTRTPKWRSTITTRKVVKFDAKRHNAHNYGKFTVSEEDADKVINLLRK